MLSNYLKLAFRNLWRHKGPSFLNIAGLTLGLITGLLMLMWVNDEQSFDQFHEKKDQLFRVHSLMNAGNDGIDVWRTAPEPWADLAKVNLPEVRNAAVLSNAFQPLKVDQQSYEEEGCYASPALFDMFSFEVVKGDLGTALAEPNSIVISSSLAAKLFGVNWEREGRTIGQSIEFGDSPVQVTAVFEDIPFQSSIKFDYVLPLAHYLKERPWARESWGNYNFALFLELNEGADRQLVGDKMFELIKNNTKAGAPENGIFLHAMKDLYLYSKFENGKVAGGRIDYVRIFFWASIFVLLIASINYMNLVTARSSQRAKEVGVRKVVGADKGRLLGQFLVESLVMTMIAGMLTLIITQLLLPAFNQLTAKAITIGLTNVTFWGLFAVVLLGTALVAGSYPAILLSSFKVMSVLKGKLKTSWLSIQLRRGLVVLQFSLSILLLIGALVVRQQIGFFKTKDLGLNRNNVILFNTWRLGEENVEKMDVLRAELLQLPEIAEVAAADSNPLSIEGMTGDPEWEGFQEGDQSIFTILTIDHTFLGAMDIPIVEGQAFEEGMPTDSANFKYIINEEAAVQMGLEDPLNKRLQFWGDHGRIIGVVKDFHFSSLHEPIKPLILRYQPEKAWGMLVKPSPGQTKEAITALENMQQKLAPANEFEYTFLDQYYEKMYRSEERTSDLADLFAIIALLISTLGLFGLATFMAEQRTKEIGIRKVLGASMGNILLILNKELGQLIALAFVIATPVAWWLMNSWLEKFAYHMTIGWQVVGMAGLILILVALFTVSFHSIKTALSNPIEALKYE